MNTPDTHYLRTDDDVYIAYQVVGDGPVDVAVAFHLVESNVDLMWDDPDWRPFLTGMAEFARLILHDARGLGVSSRNVPPPNLETRAADLLAVLDVVGSSRPILVAGGLTGSMHALFAATHPERTGALAWNTPSCRAAWAPDYPWGGGADDFEHALQRAETWGTAGHARRMADVRAAERAGIATHDVAADAYDHERLNAYAKIHRNTTTPDVAGALVRMDWETDARGILPSVTAPAALLVGDKDDVEEARYIASLMPNATLQVIKGRSGVAVDPFLAMLRHLAGVRPPAPELDTVLATVMFTDIVDSTEKQASLGDRAWKALVLAHHELIRGSLGRWRGLENDTAGDGFYATFDGPARALRCALEVVERVRDLGIEIRAGLHTGECEVIDGKRGGLAVSIGARVAALAAPSQVFASQTVKDLVAGSGFTFEDAGERQLKGIPDRWRVYRVAG